MCITNFLTLDIKVGCSLKTIAERKQLLLHTMMEIISTVNDDDSNGDDHHEKPGRVQQLLTHMMVTMMEILYQQWCR